jgi:hypothetical protein
MIPASLVRLLALPLLGAWLAGCPAVYPEIGTRTRAIPVGVALDPPPPAELKWLRVVSAHIPEKTRDGRAWGAGGKPAAYAKVFVNGKELFATGTQSGTFEPTWPEAPRGNFKLAPSDKLSVELWDTGALSDKPIGVQSIGAPTEQHLMDRSIRVEMESGAVLVLAFEPAHAVSGLGLWFELRTESCFVTRLLEGSPSERAGLVAGDEVLKIGAREAKTMSPGELQSAFNAPPLDGLSLTVRHAAGSVTDVKLKEGPIYPSFSQFGRVD